MMATLLVAGNSEGIHGRCDAKCHDATEPECRCICGGLYHGSRAKGGQAELDRRRTEYGNALLEELASRERIPPTQGALL